jgi:hydrogenase/urease accessory protein HupE
MIKGLGSRSTLVAVPVGLVGVLWPAVAEAHLVTSGLGPIYDGIAHVLVSPEDLVPIVAMGFAAGMNGSRSGRDALFLLTGAWLAGGFTGATIGQPLGTSLITTASFLVLGALVALDLRLSPTVIRALATAVGFLQGWLNGAGMAAEGREMLGLVGIGGTVFVLTAISASGVIALRAAWSRVAIRVAGSWVAATGLLMLGWGLRAVK